MQCCINFCWTAKWISHMYTWILSFLDLLPFQFTTEHSLCYPVVTYRLSFFPKFIVFCSHFSLLISAFRDLTLSLVSIVVILKGASVCISVLIFYHISCEPLGISTKMPCCFFKYRCEKPSFISPHPHYPHFCLWHPLCKQAPKLGRLTFFLSSLIPKPWNTPRLGTAMDCAVYHLALKWFLLHWSEPVFRSRLKSYLILGSLWLLWIIFIFLLSHDCF